MRRECLFDCLLSIKKYYPSEQIIIADQNLDNERYSESLCKELDINASVLNLPFDCGLSYARNRMVDKASTELVVILDDDMIVSNDNFNVLADILIKYNLDICGGYYKHPNGKRASWDGVLWIEDDILRFEPVDIVSPYTKVSIMANVFVACKEKLREVSWNEDFKIGREHLDFFWRAQVADLVCGLTNIHIADHRPVKNEAYLNFRKRKSIKQYDKKLLEIIGVSSVHSDTYNYFNLINNK
jgi:GT2 family glycosyltransferase